MCMARQAQAVVGARGQRCGRREGWCAVAAWSVGRVSARGEVGRANACCGRPYGERGQAGD